tara:strand:- start:1813 stop:2130 length:318 start_codon:yes stop_codon:yes gene_type:complete
MPSIGSGIAGVVYGWEQNFDFDDSYLYIKVNPDPKNRFTHPLMREKRTVEFVSAPTKEVLENYEPNWFFYAQSLVKKAEPIYRAMGWDMSAVTRDRKQTTLDEWF